MAITRTLWMFPRPIRQIDPAKVGLIMRVLSNTLHLAGNTDLKKDKSAQDYFENNLSNQALKVKRQTGHANPGGARTYFSLLDQLGLIYFKPSEDDSDNNAVYLTNAGIALAELKQVDNVMRTQLLRMQFPSPYGFSQKVLMNPKVVVRPAIFLCQMLRDPRLGGLITDTDVMIACVYGSNHRMLNKVVTKCVTARKKFLEIKNPKVKMRRFEAFVAILENPGKDLATEAKPHDAGNTNWLNERFSAITHDANVLTQRMKSVGLIIPSLADDSPYLQTGYVLNSKHQNLVERIEQKDKPRKQTDYQTNADWQRSLGRGTQEKDTRKADHPAKFYDLDNPREVLKQRAVLEAERQGPLFNKTEFCRKQVKNGTLELEDILSVVEEALPSVKPGLEEQFSFLSTNRDRSTDFEKAVEHVLKASFQNCKVRHTGQERRIDKSRTDHNYADVALNTTSHECILFDTKATRKPYGYGSADQSKSQDYVKYPGDALENTEHGRIVALVFIAPAFTKDAFKKAVKSSERTGGVPFVLLTASEFVALVTLHKANVDNFLANLLELGEKQNSSAS